METIIWVAVLAILVLLVVVIKRQKSGKSPDLYVCGHCGEKDCDCAKQANSPWRP